MSYPPPPPPIQPPQPIPVQPLGYTSPTYRRPGVLTAVAVTSIVVASLSILTSGAMTLQGFGMMVASRFAPRVTATAGTGTTTPLPTTPDGGAVEVDEEVDADGMVAADRRMFMAGLSTVHALSEARQEQLDALLARAGRKVLPMTGEALTRHAVAANVTDAGQFPASSGKAAGADFFVLARGRVEVSDDHAVFYPAEGGDAVRVSASEEAEDGAGDGPTTGTQGLTDAQVTAVIARIESTAGTKLTSQQARTLRKDLRSPAQQVFVPVRGLSVANQVTSASASGGTVTIAATSGLIVLRPNGTSQVTAFGGFGPGGTGFPKIGLQAGLAMTGSLLSLGLAVLLLVAGILVIRNSPGGRRWHLIYAGLKLPLAVAAGAAWAWMWWSFFKGMTTGAGAGPVWAPAVTFAVPTVLGLIYPVALLVVMNTRAVREYYATER